MNVKSAQGLALICDLGGMIQEILRNDLEIPEAVPGNLFFRIVETSSRQKAMSFLTEIKARISLPDWELDIFSFDGIQTMHFSGSLINETILITAATDGKFAREIFEEMLRINNEQTNLLRAAIKDGSTAAQAMRDIHDFEEITRLNNELVAMQRELAKNNAELARLNALKNQFLGMAAHDLRHPLQGILFYSEFLLESPEKLDGDQIEFITLIRNQSRYMSNLVEDLLDVATIESGKLQLDLQATDFTALLTENLNRNRRIAARKHISLELDAQPIPRMLLDPSKMEQVLDNLISNALKYSPAGGRVQIRMRSVEQEILVSVHDEGPGIPPAEQSLLFKPFQRTSVKSSSGEKSSGLGLAIARRIINGHAGRIWVESQPECGATFSFSLPISINPAG